MGTPAAAGLTVAMPNASPLPPPLAPAPPPRRPWRWWALALLVVGPAVLYAQTLSFGLLGIDDTIYFIQHPAWHQPLAEALRTLWSRPYFHDYSPLTLLTIGLDHALGVPQRMASARVQQLLWLGLGTLALFQLVRRLADDDRVAWAVALLFSVHPVVAESVLWLAERKNLVAAALSWWAIERHVAWRQGAGWPAALLACALCVLALLAKPHAIIIPAVLAAYEVFLGTGGWGRRLAALAPSTLAVAGFFLLNVCGFHLYDSQGLTMLGGSLAGAVCCDGAILVRYLGHTLLPQHLALFYDAVEDPHRWPLLVGCWLLVVVVIGGTIAIARSPRRIACAWCAAGASLLPVLNLQAMPLRLADHYLHWALPWLLWILVEVLVAIGGRVRGLAPGMAGAATSGTVPVPPGAPLACAGLALCFALGSLARVPEFRSRDALDLAQVLHQPSVGVGWADVCFCELNRPQGDATVAGRAGLAALQCADADRIFLLPYLSCAIYGTLACQRQSGPTAADRLLARALDRLSPVERAYVRGTILELSHRPQDAVAVLRPWYTAPMRDSAHTVLQQCRTRAVLPWEVPPAGRFATTATDADDPDTDATVTQLALGMLARAELEVGAAEEAEAIASFLVNVAPRSPFAAKTYRLICRAKGDGLAVRRIEQELLAP